MKEKIKPRISIIGLGKLGSPMAAVFASKGFETIGLDLNSRFVEAINAGRAPVEEPLLQEMIDAEPIPPSRHDQLRGSGRKLRRYFYYRANAVGR